MTEKTFNDVAVATIAASGIAACSSLGFLLRRDWKASAVAGWTSVGLFVSFVVADGRAEAKRKAARAR